ncbi:hypothetical protein KAH94_03950 [bacterium]|nr:hypothetical protein [bacterium]
MKQKNNLFLKVLLFSSLCITCNLSAAIIKISSYAISAPASLGRIKLLRDENGFYITQNGRTYFVDNDLVETRLLTMSDSQLQRVLLRAKIRVTKMSNGEFSLKLETFF